MSVKKRTLTITPTNGKVFHLTDVAKALRSKARTVALSGLWYGVVRLYREHWNVIHDDSHTCVAIGCMEFGAEAAGVLKKWARDGRGV